MEINRSDKTPIHTQVAGEIRRAIIEGEIGAGDRLPPAVSLGAILGVNKNTVSKALHVLRDEGLLDFTRGRGIHVVGTPQRGIVMQKIDELLEISKTYGYGIDEILTLAKERKLPLGNPSLVDQSQFHTR